uniref:Uncharacterized protein LOC104245669 n=1 Tax=Nicotiana sylvestris TaxID=4096 RepID=A0A1U7YCD4_NICSY|nr:PREDICTED: uncharacterized protein LOC104245669 [Nicotiana sylvestris]
MTEIIWWHSKEAYMMTYRAKLMPVRGEKFWKVLPEHAMDPPPRAKTVGRPKVKRNREKDEANKRQGDWAASRRGTRMTCSICGELDHNSRTCKVGGEGNVEDVSCSAPQPTQPTQEGERESEFVFMPTPRVPIQQAEPFGDGSEHESDPALMPKIISEDQTRLLMRQQQLASAGTRVISFKRDHSVIPLIFLTHLLSSLGKAKKLCFDSVYFVGSSAGSLLGSRLMCTAYGRDLVCWTVLICTAVLFLLHISLHSSAVSTAYGRDLVRWIVLVCTSVLVET